ncbi:MAG TPA: SIS domain-containing protein [Planctomycetes bacterium]|nr:SIS domain-containing protein [Planctomycetota bacterium]
MLGYSLDSEAYFDRLRDELARINHAQLRQLADLIYAAWDEGRFVFFFGNGGSAAAASHLAEDLGKNCIPQTGRPRRLKVMSLTDNAPWITALGNDLGYDRIFVEQLAQYGSPGDVAVAISGSGNSPNVLAAVQWANENGLLTVGVTGYDGGKLKAMARYSLHVPLDDMAMVESIHLCLAHWLVDDLYARINCCGRYAE